MGVALFSWIAGKWHEHDVKKGKKASRKIEDIELPGFMSIFNENMVCTALLMTLFFGIILLLLGRDYLTRLASWLRAQASCNRYTYRPV